MVKNMLPTRQLKLTVSLLLSVAWGVAAWGETPPDAPVAPPRETPVVADWRSGLALHGMDPVAYFAEARAAPGLAAYEFRFAGAIWRFRNEGNRAAFVTDPGSYVPRFSGYDPVAIGRGAATPGNPLVWLVVGPHLYLFHGYASREAFAADPENAVAAAEAKWPSVADTLDPNGALSAVKAAPAGQSP